MLRSSRLLSLLTLCGFVVISMACNVSAVDTKTDTLNVSVPISCSLSATGTTSHNATISPGVYYDNDGNGIGLSTITTFCNDASGFAIYAIGYGNNIYGNNTLEGENTGSTIGTKVYAPGDTTSNWSMRVNKVTEQAYIPNNLTITNSFDSWHTVPDTYTKVANYTASTDTTLGSKITSTYAAFISANQPADTYHGQVLYTLVHPNDAPAPVPVSKNLYYAITGSANNYTLTISDSDITSGAVAGGSVAVNGYNSYSSRPWNSYNTSIKSVVVDGTVAPTSTAYWFYNLQNCDSWDLDGLRTDHVTTMNSMFYSAGYSATTFSLDLSSWNTANVKNMVNMFSRAGHNATTFFLDLSSWDTSNVTNMYGMFDQAGYATTTFSLDVSSWDTSKVESMEGMFRYAGYNTTIFSPDLSEWNTSSVRYMSAMFYLAGYNSTTFSLDLSSWNTSKVTDMSSMFQSAGNSATTWSVGDLSSWNTSNVTNMSQMFSYAGYRAVSFTLDLSFWNTSNVTYMSNMFNSAGYSATTWSVTIPKTNDGTATGPISNTASSLYGKTASVTATPPSGKSFTLAN